MNLRSTQLPGRSAGLVIALAAASWWPVSPALCKAAEPYLVKDLNTDPAPPRSSDPEWLAEAGGILYFSAMAYDTGRELWRTDGTPEGTWLVKDIAPGWGSSEPGGAVAFGDRLFFRANDGEHGEEPWITDGTPEGTRMIADIRPGAEGSMAFPPPQPECETSQGRQGFPSFVLAGRVAFPADDGEHGRELWSTDGTPEGTWILRDIRPGPEGSASPWESYDVRIVLQRAFFEADDGEHGRELWVTDGTPEGSVLVRDIRAGEMGSDLHRLRVVGDRLIFAADDGLNGTELWASDGTFDGTTLLADLRPGAESSYPAPVGLLGDRLLFSATSGSSGTDLWVTDGTQSGTTLLKGVCPGGNPYASGLATVGGRYLFTADDGVHGRELWATDGTQAGTVILKDIRPGSGVSFEHAELDRALAFGRRVLFSADDGDHGPELWITDGTPPGTVLLKDISPGRFGSQPTGLTAWGDGVLFCAEDGGHGYELWMTDGTAEGTALLEDVRPGSDASINPWQGFELRIIGDRAVFLADDGLVGKEPWVTDRTEEGTRLLSNIRSDGGTGGSDLSLLAPFRDGALFLRNDPEKGQTIWKSDGTEEGTQLVKEVGFVERPWWRRRATAVLGDRALFALSEVGGSGLEPWVSDGTPEGTGVLADIAPHLADSGFTPLGDRVLFSGFDPEHGRELWATDGTADGTALVQDIWPGPDSSDPRNLTALGDRVVFAAEDPEHGWEIWVTDGTPAGTELLADTYPGPDHGLVVVHEFVRLGDQALFWGDDGEHGAQVWATDGTPGGTQPVQGSWPLPQGVASLVSMGEQLIYFDQRDALGWEPWVSDGRSEGTRLLRDVYPGPAPSPPLECHGYPVSPWIALERRVVTVLDDGLHGFELWWTDGTSEGTELVADIGPGSSVEAWGANLVAAPSGLLFFLADDGIHGSELWALPPSTGLWASFTLAPRGCQPGRKVTLDGSASTAPEGARIASYRFDLGGGTTLEGPQVEHEYAKGAHGLQRICLTVTDDLGGTHTTCREFCIRDPFRFLRADCSGDGDTGGVTDAIYLLGYNFLGGEAPPCLAACDSDGDGTTGGVTDAIYLLGYNFLGTPPPPAPFPECGPPEAPTDEDLGCERQPEGCR